MITVCSITYSKGLLRVCGEIELHVELFVSPLKKLGGYVVITWGGYFLKELLMSGSGS